MGSRLSEPIGLANNLLFDSGTMCRHESSLPGPIGLSDVVHHDEITPIAQYIANEMNTNVHGADVKSMAKMNSFSTTACITDFSQLPFWKQILGLGIKPEQCVNMQLSYRTAALLAWALKVRQDGDWDHKPKIAVRFHPRAPTVQHYHLYGSTLYFYDVWSNIHYGYVGMAAGFSKSILLDGAGLEQIGSDLLRLELPKKTLDSSELRAWDDSEDRIAIEIGIRLYQRNPNRVTAKDVFDQVFLYTRQLNTKPYFP